jgi:hypothetical protein
MDTELQQVTSTEPVAVSPLINQTEAELAQAIVNAQTGIGADPNTAPSPIQGQAPVAQTPVPTAQTGQVAPQQTTTPTSPNNPVTPETQTVEAKSDGVTFEQLQSKAGFKSPDALADSYVNLRKDYERKSQELAQVRRQEIPAQMGQPVAQPNTPVAPVAPAPTDVDAFFAKQVEQKGVVAAIAELADLIAQQRLQPVMQNYGQIELRDTINKLSSAPDTARTFVHPDVQTEMHKIIQEHPDRYMNNLAASMPEIHDMAVGRLARRAAVTSGVQTVQPTAATTQAGFMEGKNKPVTPQPVNPSDMPLDQLESYIRNVQRTIV